MYKHNEKKTESAYNIMKKHVSPKHKSFLFKFSCRKERNEG